MVIVYVVHVAVQLNCDKIVSWSDSGEIWLFQAHLYLSDSHMYHCFFAIL